jgi:hypothetical protein
MFHNLYSSTHFLGVNQRECDEKHMWHIMGDMRNGIQNSGQKDSKEETTCKI